MTVHVGRDVLLFGINKAPNLIALDAAREQMSNMLIVVFRARFA
jgi:hypothetical protein